MSNPIEGQGESPDSPASETPAVYNSQSSPYGAAEPATPPAPATKAELARRQPPSPPPPPADDDDDDPEEQGMLRMSFMEHLEELRSRILRAIMGLAVAFLASMFFSKELWNVVREPAVSALLHLGIDPPELAQISPMEGFNIIWIKLPLLVSVFLGSPWILYQAWGFISPGLYKREKRLAVPFILSTAGLFISGGLFAYYVAFRYGLEFLLGIGRDVGVRPLVSITEYFDLFVNVTLGVALVFELPVIIFFLTLLRLASPRFLLRHSRYAILAIVVIAAVVTPTPDIFNMMIFAIPMVALYFVGLFASFVLVLRREGKPFPWKAAIGGLVGLLVIAGGLGYYFIWRYGMHFVKHWPFLVK